MINSQNHCIPDFLIIGAQKSATTTLHRNLSLHDQLGLSKLKEANYFSQKFEKGIEWYQRYLKRGDLVGESSPSYTMRHLYPETAERIHACNPDMRLIYILRDPIDRIVSHLHHDLYRDRLKSRDIDRLLRRKNNPYINTSRYFWQLQAYLDFFPNSQLLVVDFDRLKENPEFEYNSILNFLGISKPMPESVRSSHYTSEKRYLIKYFDQLHQFDSWHLHKLYHHFFYLLNIKIPRPEISNDQRLFLRDELSADFEEIQSYCGFKLSWSNFC